MASCALAFLLSWVSVLWSGEGTISLGLSYPLGTLLVHYCGWLWRGDRSSMWARFEEGFSERHWTPFHPGFGTGLLGTAGPYCLLLSILVLSFYYWKYHLFQNFGYVIFMIMGLKSPFANWISFKWLKLSLWFFLHYFIGWKGYLKAPLLTERWTSLGPTNWLESASRSDAGHSFNRGF